MIALRKSHRQNCRLAIVIPAYKGGFLDDALTSLTEQTNRDFKVYIGDDASPDNLGQIVARFQGSLHLHYCKFSDNLGKASLTKHWGRCVALSSEPYFCLFADDDLLHRTCVADFYDALEDSNMAFDVYRFKSAVIDKHGELIAYDSLPVQPESHTSFLQSRLQHSRYSFISSYVFRRDAYEREGGYVDFPLAWCSDDASVILCSRQTGIWNIAGNPAYWRQSLWNISTPNKNTYQKKIDAMVKYVIWIADQSEKGIIQLDSLERKEFQKMVERWFFRNLKYSGSHRLSIKRKCLITLAISPYCHSNKSTLFLKLHR